MDRTEFIKIMKKNTFLIFIIIQREQDATTKDFAWYQMVDGKNGMYIMLKEDAKL